MTDRAATSLASFLDSDLLYSFRRSRVTVIAAIVTLGMILAALLAPWIAPHDPFNVATLSLLDAELPPAWSEAGDPRFLLGTDNQGRDVLSAILCRISGGEIRFEGRRIDNLSREEMRRIRGKKIGAIFQDPLTSLNPLFTVGQQLIETIQMHLPMGRDEARRRAIELLAGVGIPAPERRIDHHPHQFSGGMRQRVVIALALCANPKLIVADEPTTALDVSIQAQILALLKRLCREHGAAVILVTHDMGVIAETADRVAVMYSGRIAEIGPVAQVVNAPRHPYTRGLMGSIPVVGANLDRLAQIEGAMPRLSDIPPGCPFHPRCPNAMADCARIRPEPRPVGDSRVACLLYERADA